MEATTINYLSNRDIPFKNIIESNIVLSWQFTLFISHANPSTKATESDLKTSDFYVGVYAKYVTMLFVILCPLLGGLCF